MTPMSVVRGALNVDHEYTDPMLSWTRKDAGTAFQRLKSVGASDPSLLSQCRKPRAVAATGVTSSLLPLSSSRTAAPKRTENTHTRTHKHAHTHAAQRVKQTAGAADGCQQRSEHVVASKVLEQLEIAA